MLIGVNGSNNWNNLFPALIAGDLERLLLSVICMNNVTEP